MGEVLRGASGSHPAGVLGEGAVPDTEEAVFDQAMAMVRMLCAPEIGRVEVSLTLARAAGEP